MRIFPRHWKSLSIGLLAALGLCGTGCEKVPQYQAGEELLGGDTTIFDTTENAFGFSARNLSRDRKKDFFVGNSFFRQNWVIAPASTAARDGLGPIFNARSCSACHFKDGRGRPPIGDEEMVGLLFRVSEAGEADPHHGIRPDPVYGDQIQHLAIPGHLPEATPIVRYEEITGHFADGESYTLQRPIYTLSKPNYGPLSSSLQVSPRVAPQMIGMGLLEAIPESTIVGRADPDDTNKDGISGRPNWVWNFESGQRSLGRFGWKANQPTVRQQVAGAFAGDLGITSSLFSREAATSAQTELHRAKSGGDPELEDRLLDAVTFYSAVLAVPARRNVQDPAVLRGRELFQKLNCVACHTPEVQTGTLPGFPELSQQTIRPYTDLLLHDMGEALADGRPDYEATGREWRTPPLWGIGLLPVVNQHSNLLHDGRARTIEEAILWHGGEAEASAQAYRELPKSQRQDLLRFLESL